MTGYILADAIARNPVAFPSRKAASAPRTAPKAQPPSPYGFEPYLSGKGTRKTEDLARILQSRTFSAGNRAYAVRVYRGSDDASPKHVYQWVVRANGLADLRAKLIRTIPWDPEARWPTDVRIYKNANIDKYNRAGTLSLSPTDKRTFVWQGEDAPYDSKVEPRTGRISSTRYEQDTLDHYGGRRSCRGYSEDRRTPTAWGSASNPSWKPVPTPSG
jgi:hypothetical protein